MPCTENNAGPQAGDHVGNTELDPITTTNISHLNGATAAPRWHRWAAKLGLSLLLAGCGSPVQKPPAPAPGAQPRPATQPGSPSGSPGSPSADAAKPQGAAATPAAPVLGPPRPVRSHEELRRQAAERLVAANPERVYMGEVPAVLLAIPVLEIELERNGHVKAIRVLRRPGQALDTIELAMAAVRRAAPFGDVSQLPHPWKFNEVFLFNDDRRFKPRTLDE